MLGHHASAEEVEQLKPKTDPFASPSRVNLSLPFFPPRLFSSTPVWRGFNAAYYMAQSRHRGTFLSHYRPYFFPLDGIANWNRVYGRDGFIEYQFAVPLRYAEQVCREVVERLAHSRNGSFLAVLKRLGPASGGHMSFPIEGVTLAVDMPARGGVQADLLRKLDQTVASAGGRIYLVKDSRASAELMDVMYPRRREWAQLVNEYDPEGIFTSSLVRRLELRRA